MKDLTQVRSGIDIKHKELLENENCTTCGYFLSFQDEYEDEKEPDNYGTCSCDDSPIKGNKGAGESEVCYCHSKFEDNIQVQFYKHSLEAWDWSNDTEDVINLESFEGIIKSEKLRWYKKLANRLQRILEYQDIVSDLFNYQEELQNQIKELESL